MYYTCNEKLLLIVSNDIDNDENLELLSKKVFEFVLNFKYTSRSIPDKIGVQYKTKLGSTRLVYKTRDWDCSKAVYDDLRAENNN